MAAPMLRSCLARSFKYCVNPSKDFSMLKIHTCVCSYSPDVEKRKVVLNDIDNTSTKTVLNFFNNCDIITLRKLMYRNKALFQDLDPMAVVTRGSVSKRFEGIQSLQDYLKLDKTDMTVVKNIIITLNHIEHTSFGISRISPPFRLEHKKNLEKLVTVEVYQKMVAWVEESLDRTVISMGQQHMEYQQIGSHVDFQQQIIEAVNKIPESSVYLMQLSQDAINEQRFHQATIQALIVTLLNCRKGASFKLTFGSEFNNKVFMVHPNNLEEYYGLVYYKDIYSWDMAQKWINNEPCVFTGIKMSEEILGILKKYRAGQSLLVKCMLISDMFCRTLKKSNLKFPRAYTTHDGI